MKGILLAAGKGTRLYPMTLPVCKPLLPVYDKPLIYYPLAALLQAGIRDILIIIPPGEEALFTRLLGDGSRLGVHITYAVQQVPRGIADAFLVGEDFIGDDSVCLVLGDNIFHEQDLVGKLAKARTHATGATVFGYYVDDPRAFGVVEFDENGRAISIEEKPRFPKSNYIVPGLYFYDNRVVSIAKTLHPSARGELEITDVNNRYLQMGELSVVTLGRDFLWLDAGTADNLLAASQAVKRAQEQSGRYIACLEEIAYRSGFITVEQVHEQGLEQSKTLYGQYLMCI
ncbi:MAG: glucose-1-phosphate thymidylyltransferase RfbA [Intestinibacillus sp.]